MQILSTVELTKSYKRRKVVDDISLEIAQGEVVGLLGPNFFIKRFARSTSRLRAAVPVSGSEPLMVALANETNLSSRNSAPL